MRGNPRTWSPRKRKPDRMMIAAIAGVAMVFALGLGSVMGIGLMLYFTQRMPQTESVASPAPVVVEPAPIAGEPVEPMPVGPTTIVPASLATRPPPSSDDPVVVMMDDLAYERAAAAAAANSVAAAPPRDQAPSSSPSSTGAHPTVVEGLVAAVQRLLGIEPSMEAPGGLEPVTPAREVVAVEPTAPPAPAPAPAPREAEPAALSSAAVAPMPRAVPRPEPEPVAMLAPAPSPRPAPARREPAPVPQPAPVTGGPIDLDAAEDEMDLDLFAETFDEAELFVAPTLDDTEPTEIPPDLELEPAEPFDRLDTILVEVVIDEADVPIKVDGRDMGTVPGVVQLPAGVHTVELYYRGETSKFTLPAAQDPERWCFERKGREFRRSEC